MDKTQTKSSRTQKKVHPFEIGDSIALNQEHKPTDIVDSAALNQEHEDEAHPNNKSGIEDTEHFRIIENIIVILGHVGFFIGYRFRYDWVPLKQFLFVFGWTLLSLVWFSQAYTQIIHYRNGDYFRILEPLSMYSYTFSVTFKFAKHWMRSQDFYALVFSIRTLCRRNLVGSRADILQMDLLKTLRLVKLYVLGVAICCCSYCAPAVYLFFFKNERLQLLPIQFFFIDDSELSGYFAMSLVHASIGFFGCINTAFHGGLFTVIIANYILRVNLVEQDLKDLDVMWHNENKTSVAYKRSFLVNVCKKLKQKQIQRKKATEEEKKRLKDLDTKRRGNARRNEERLGAEAAARALSRQRETAAQTEKRRVGDRQAHVLARQKETAVQTEKRRVGDRQAHVLARQKETAAQTEKRREDDRQAHVLARQKETAAQTEKRREDDRQAHALARQQETADQTRARKKADAQAHANRLLRDSERLPFIQRMQQVQQIGSEHFDETVVNEHSCGPMNVICQFCGSRNFAKEQPQDKMFTTCCQKGTFFIPKADMDYPDFLRDLLSNPANPNYRNFRDNIRNYNSSLSFASMGAKIVDVPGRGPYVFKVNGQVHHRTSHLEAVDGQPKYAQLYVLDSSTQAVSERMSLPENQGCIPALMYQIDGFLRQHNRVAQTYQLMREVHAAEKAKADLENRPAPVVRMEMRRNRDLDQGRYNLPTANEVAMIFVDDDGEPPFERDIRIYPRNPVNQNQQFVNLNILSSNLDPMTYALLYPYGEPGWYPDLILNGRKVSMLEYKSAQLAIRDTFNPIISAGKLTQQWIVDSYLQVEANNLNYVRTHQSKLRADQYKGLADHVAKRAQSAGLVAGTPIILPSTFSGSPRNMRERLQDAMSIFGKFGAPDLFITFTANPSWKEIEENLKRGEVTVDRPDLVAKVFQLKLKALIEDITKNMVLGFAIAHVYTIEFQKRGLPHAHILIVLHDADKFKSTEKIDQIVCAEIPDKDRNPRLHEIVTRCMLHGPCGSANPTAGCMENGKCKKEFPKAYNETTQKNSSGYPDYRRRTGTFVNIRGQIFDNRHVVPYNKYLTLKYNAHINVECCTSLRAVKYIYKYIYKGFDCADVVITEDGTLIHDEIANYINARYVSAPEAMWRLLVFKMHGRSHSINQLPVHLHEQQTIRFKVGNEQQALEQAAAGYTQLTAWFELNKNDTAAREILYADIPYHYTFKKGKWKPRERQQKTISRMYTVGPGDEERFHLRLLLLHVPGATSYDYLRTVDGVIYPTFKIAAFHRNLLASDDEWYHCLEEAAVFQMPPQMRQTFAFICIFCAPKEPLDLWENFKEDMVIDFLRHYDKQTSYNLALLHIESILNDNRRSCFEFGLPKPTGTAQTPAEYDQDQERLIAERLVETLNPQQRLAFDQIIKGIDNPTSKKLFFLNGPGGSGKTYLYNTLISFVRSRGQKANAYATTGIASTLMSNAYTVHRGFGLPVPITDTSTSRIKLDSPQADVLRQASLIIIDECTMLTKDGLRCIDLLLREIMKLPNVPFGGKVVIVGGDFRQTLPVVPRGSRAAIIESCLKSSSLWKHFTELSLISNMRSEGENDFNNWLLDVGIANTPRIDGLNDGAIKIPREMMITDNIVSTIFTDNIQHLSTNELSRRVILAATNKETLEINNQIIEGLDGDIKIYNSSDELISEDVNDFNNYPTEFLHSLQLSGMPPHELRLKVGTIVMLLRNLNPSRGLCNGTRLIVRRLNERSITCEILSDNHKGDIVIISRIDIAPSDNNLPFTLKRRQFPIIPAFAITINKSQGQTFDFVGINLTESVFAHGQLYVALSRSRNPTNIKVLINERTNQGRMPNDWDDFYTQNVVFEEIFR